MSHMLLMSFNNDEYMNLSNSLNRFIEYAFILAKKNRINFCYIGTAAKDSFLERKFFSLFIRSKFGKHVYVSHLLLTKEQFTPQQMEDFLAKQDILFIGGGNTENMLQIWEKSGFTQVLNKLKKESRLPILAGVSAGGMYPFHSGITDSQTGHYKPLSCFQWIKNSFCAHSNSKIKAICAFENNQNLTRMEAYTSAIKSGLLPEGYAVPDDCMLHFYNCELLQAFTSRANNDCYYVTSEKSISIKTHLLTAKNIFEMTIQPVVDKLSIDHKISFKANCLYYLFKCIHIFNEIVAAFKRLAWV